MEPLAAYHCDIYDRYIVTDIIVIYSEKQGTSRLQWLIRSHEIAVGVEKARFAHRTAEWTPKEEASKKKAPDWEP